MLALLGVKKAPLIAGLIGGILSLRFVKELNGFLGYATGTIGGAAAGGYMAPWVSEYYNLTPSAMGALGFLFGMFGLSLAAAVFTAISKTDFSDIIKSAFKRGGGS
jgi:hypothetical protein